jgi:hypothetical protein
MCFVLSSVLTYAQQDGLPQLGSYVKVTKEDGAEYLGKLVAMDDRELRLDSTQIGSVVIPRYLIAGIRTGYTSLSEVIKRAERQDRFSTRYFLTTNGFSNSEDGSYILFNIYGPDFQFAISDHVTAGILTTWIGSPTVGSLKYSASINENLHGAVGLLAGSSGWLDLGLYFGVPYASATFGSRINNPTVSAGYGIVALNGESNARTLLSVAGTTPVWGRVAFIFDSMILPEISDSRGTLMFASPGIRWFASNTTAFQFGYPFYLIKDGSVNEFGAAPFPTFGVFVKM